MSRWTSCEPQQNLHLHNETSVTFTLWLKVPHVSKFPSESLRDRRSACALLNVRKINTRRGRISIPVPSGRSFETRQMSVPAIALLPNHSAAVIEMREKKKKALCCACQHWSVQNTGMILIRILKQTPKEETWRCNDKRLKVYEEDMCLIRTTVINGVFSPETSILWLYFYLQFIKLNILFPKCIYIFWNLLFWHRKTEEKEKHLRDDRLRSAHSDSPGPLLPAAPPSTPAVLWDHLAVSAIIAIIPTRDNYTASTHQAGRVARNGAAAEQQ